MGIDFPNANLIIIENANKFGLSQLHQLRGRVGRGEKQGMCILLFKHGLSKNAIKRIKVLKESNDGFFIAENIELKLKHFWYGRKIKDFKPGDRVLVSLIRACGECELCRENEPTSCLYAYDEEPSPLKDLKNEVIFKGMKTGAFADHVVVSAEQCVKVPNELPLDEASLLSCGVLTGYGSVYNTAKLKTGQSVVVIGSGGVGLNTIQAARIKSASHIIAIDISNEKLKIARNFGATATVKASGQSIEDTVKSLTNGLGVNYVFVTVGDPEAFLYAQSLLKSGGSIVLVGLPQSGTQVPYDAMKLSAMNQSILGSRMGKGVLSRDIPKLIKLWKAGKLQLRELISKKFELTQINEAIRDSKRRKNL